MGDDQPQAAATPMTISLIAAMGENRVIGRDGDLPWHLPDEMRYFVRTTTGHTVIMGRKTFESFGHPLPRRRNIVITRDRAFAPQGAEVAHSLSDALAMAAGDGEVFIAGGGEIYRQALPRADRLYLTVVHASPAGDTRFPAFDDSGWKRTQQTHHPADDRHAFAFTFHIYERDA